MWQEIWDFFLLTPATQVIPRERYAEMQFLIALIGSTLDKIAVEIRNLQRTEIGEAPSLLEEVKLEVALYQLNVIQSKVREFRHLQRFCVQ